MINTRKSTEWIIDRLRSDQSSDGSWNYPFETGISTDAYSWAAFEKNTNSKLLDLLPIEKGRFILADPTCADITGRTLEFLGNYTNMPGDQELVKKAIRWLVKNQEQNGSWYCRRGICYIYGTWAALTGLMSVGISPRHGSVERAVEWLIKILNEDGGWGSPAIVIIKENIFPLVKAR